MAEAGWCSRPQQRQPTIVQATAKPARPAGRPGTLLQPAPQRTMRKVSRLAGAAFVVQADNDSEEGGALGR